jgi:hypothetical protein
MRAWSSGSTAPAKRSDLVSALRAFELDAKREARWCVGGPDSKPVPTPARRMTHNRLISRYKLRGHRSERQSDWLPICANSKVDKDTCNAIERATQRGRKLLPEARAAAGTGKRAGSRKARQNRAGGMRVPPKPGTVRPERTDVMHAHKIKIVVTEDHEVRIKLPSDFPPGEAEVIVIQAPPDMPVRQDRRLTVDELLASRLAPPPGVGPVTLGDMERAIEDTRCRERCTRSTTTSPY